MVCFGGGTCWWSSPPSHNLFIYSPISLLQALASGALLSCSGKKVRKVVRLKGGTTRSRSNCSPLENPPGGTIGRLTLRFGSGAGVQSLHPFGLVLFRALFPTLSIGRWKKPSIAP